MPETEHVFSSAHLTVNCKDQPPRAICMSTSTERFEQELQSRIYETLVSLASARTEEKPRIVKGLGTTCRKLHDLIVHGKIPKTESERTMARPLRHFSSHAG